MATKSCDTAARVQNEELNLKTLTVTRDKLVSLEDQLDDLDNKIYELVTDKDAEEDLFKVYEYKEMLKDQISEISFEIQKFSDKLKNCEENGSIISSASAGREENAKLPLLKISPYNGDPLKWHEFWDKFQSLVHDRDSLVPVIKFNYLVSYLEGEAKNAVQGIAITNVNYPEAISLLKERFGKEEVVIFAHLDKMFSMPSSSPETHHLRAIYDQCERHIRSLRAFGPLTLDQIFAPLILSKLPQELRVTLHRKNGRKRWDLDELRASLREEIEAREMGERQFGDNKCEVQNPKVYKCPKSNLKATSEALFVSSKNSFPSCVFCSNSHYSDACPNYIDLTSRKEKLKNNCFKCLRTGHLSMKCFRARPCVHCNKKGHHRSLCPVKFESKAAVPETQSDDSTSILSVSVSNEGKEIETFQSVATGVKSCQVLAQTATINVANPKCTDCIVVLRSLFDTGSHRTFLSQKMSKRLNLKTSYYENLLIATFGASETRNVRCAVAELEVFMIGGRKKTILVSVVPIISCPVRRAVIDLKDYPKLQGLQLADPIKCSMMDSNEIDLLVGNDYYFDFIKPNRLQIGKGLVALDTEFGWMPTGRIETDVAGANHAMLALGFEMKCFDETFSLERFWTLESIGIRESGNISDDDMAIIHFNKTIKFNNGRYFVTWPWKTDEPCLPDNYQLSWGRLKSLIGRLSKTPEVLVKYDNIIRQQLESGVIEEVFEEVVGGTLTRKHYIPHHCIIKPDKSTTKIRIVYDASAKTAKHNLSLNECLFRGPVLMEDLSGVLMRFRLHKIAISCDIEKAFLQVGLQKHERDVVRFLWLKDVKSPCTPDNLIILRFCRVPFGVISSPFLLSATIAYHLRTEGTKLGEDVLRNIYVDNILFGKSSLEEAKHSYHDLKKVMKGASMNLREWSSNSEEFISTVEQNDRAQIKDNLSILGLIWNTQNDKIGIKGIKINENIIPTKRYILQKMSEVFDPLGLIAPVTVEMKIFMQDLWKKKLGWEDGLNEEMTNTWKKLSNEFMNITLIELPRVICEAALDSPNYELHCFSDASGQAYSAVVYLVAISGTVRASDVVFCKTRVSPLKEITIPRLELMGVVVGVRITEFVKKMLDLHISRTILWCDSKCVLFWIHGSRMMPIFVENRLREIRQHRDVEFRYIPTAMNPADLPTRGTSIKELIDSYIWWHGPSWLVLNENDWPPQWSVVDDISKPDEYNQENMASEYNEIDCMKTDLQEEDPLSILIARNSSLFRLLKILVRVIEFTKIIRRRQCQLRRVPSSSEVTGAKEYLLKFVQRTSFSCELDAIVGNKKNTLVNQLNLFKDANGIIRCKGRFQNANIPYDAKFPKLLPKDHAFTKLIITDIHQRLFHAGVSHTLSRIREEYWIPQGRAQVQKVLRWCLVCKKHEGRSYATPAIPPIPTLRLIDDVPFTCTGVDHFGPLYVKSVSEPNVQQKVWICLFTCAAVRAVHLEVTTELSAEHVIMAIRRFISRRGVPKFFVSDNAQGFKLTNKVLSSSSWNSTIAEGSVQSYCSEMKIEWKFIVELAPWMGGFYERMVGTVKRSLRKTIARSVLTLVQLQTIIVEVEAIVNSRPLIYVPSQLENRLALTPADFLSSSHKLSLGEISTDIDTDYDPKRCSEKLLLDRWKKGQSILNQFWSVWKNEYLPSLREKSLKGKTVKTSLEVPRVGDIVLIKDNLPRGQWKMGKIFELLPSSDGEYRSAKIILANQKEIKRATKMLIPLECSNIEESPPMIATSTQEARPTRKAAIATRKKIRNVLLRECRED